MDKTTKERSNTQKRLCKPGMFDHREALEAAIDKRKFLLKRLFRNTRYRSDS